jgi:sulfoxide reductase heme-binding subunit YedZ
MTSSRVASPRGGTGVLSRIEPGVRRWIRPLVWVLVLAPIAWMVYRGLTDQLGADPVDKLERESGRWSLRMLAAALAVTPLMRLTGWGWLVSQRRFLGLTAFFYAVAHLSVYTVLDWFFDWNEIFKDIVKHLYVTVGMLAFVLMIPLALTSTKASIKWLGGKRWNSLHRLVYVSAVAGCIHFLWAVKKDITQPMLYIGIFTVLFAFRIVWWRRGTARARVRKADGTASAPA